MTDIPESFEHWTLALLRRLYAVDDPDSLHALMLRRQINFNRAILRRRSDRLRNDSQEE